MKRIILVVLMVVMVTTPCIANEVETDGIFSLDGTLWRYFRPEINITTRPLPPSIDIVVRNGEVGFFQENVYWCSENDCSFGGSYINTPVLGIYFEVFGLGLDLYVMQPAAGLGLTTIFGCGGTLTTTACTFGVGIMFKVDNNWTPPEVE